LMWKERNILMIKWNESTRVEVLTSNNLVFLILDISSMRN